MYSYNEVGFVVIFLMNVFHLRKLMTVGRFAGVMLTCIIFISVIKPLFIVWCFCIIYRQVLQVILRYRYGSKYKGYVSGGDGIHVAEKKDTINVVAMIKNVKKLPAEEVVQINREIAWKIRHIPKFQTSFNSFGGYWYKKQEDVHIDDYVTFLPKLHKVLEKNELLDLIDDQYNGKETKETWLPWEVFVGTEPVNWADDGFEYYPILFCVHHALTDGVTSIKILIGLLGNQNVDVDVTVQPKETDYFKSVKNFDSVLELFTKVATFFWVVLTLPGSLFSSFILKGFYLRFLPTVSASQQKTMTFGMDHSREYFYKVINIKNKISATFPEVLSAAYFASLSEFIQKNNANAPKYITTIVPLLAGAMELRKLEPKDVHLKTLNVTNGYSVITLKTPVTRSLRTILDFLQEEIKINKEIYSYQINYFLLVYFLPYFPVFIVRIFIKIFCRGSLLSILPGPKQMLFENNSLMVSHCLAWAPQTNQFGTTLIINTTGNQLQIGFSADKAIIPERSAAQEIVDGIYKYLDLFEKEVNASE